MSNKIDWQLWDGTEEAGNFPVLERGPKIIGIIEVEDVVEKQYLKIKVDIIEEGPFKNHFREQAKRFEEYPAQGIIYRSYKPSAYPFLKAFVTALEKSNEGYNFKETGGDFASFRGKKLVANFAHEEIPYPNEEDGQPIITLRIAETRSIQALQNGDVKVKDDIKRLSERERAEFDAKYPPAFVDARGNDHEDLPMPTEDDLPF